MKNKNIWIINEYAGSQYHGMEFRHYYLSKELVKSGNKVTIISSSYSHMFKQLPDQSRENIDGVDYLWLKTFDYGNSHDKRRVLKWFLFTFKCFFLPFMLKKPDVIIVSPMAPFPIFPAWILSKIYRAKLIYEVKDIWPLSIIELGGHSPSHPLIRLMRWCERLALSKSDVIVSNLQNYGEHIKDLCIDRNFEWISNGVDIDELSQIEPLPKEIQMQLLKDKFIVGYTGTIGVANAMDSFLESSKYIDNDKIVFVVVGGGQEKERLMKLYENFKNIIFIDSIAKKQVQTMLSLFDVCFLGWNREKLYKYGTSANKIFDYMYSSRPILNAFSGGGDIVQIANCGVSVEAENPQAIADGIMRLYDMDVSERERLGSNGKSYVMEHFRYDNLADKFSKLL